MKETLIPVVQGHVVHVQFNTPTQRFDIHGILKECISEFLKIQNLPGNLHQRNVSILSNYPR
jgi:hypothetical protein